jgi:ribonuclease J
MAAPVRVIFLGGLGEIGRNCMVIEQDNRLLLIDCGLMFPDADMHGIDLVLPDFTWLRENADRIEACVATHGHEDHVGGLQFLLREMSFPIYGSQVTLGLARNRIEEAGLLGKQLTKHNTNRLFRRRRATFFRIGAVQHEQANTVASC